ncbi:citrate synthase [Brevibacterium iodinum ATCC 49514]|jgi:citrate synthase|uniref:Citrate synthase n=3 Tax=Brevibacterium TaxID=1696 RepID=A0A5C4X5L0_9MICO|nr:MULTISPECIES: citrate synthase [Brevibacterium]MCS4591722.1 citrate synthase [Brevibacterium sediminis]TNM57866.1 citrate synthase [Brevibacterium sediminis]UZD63540.1 citrate synthase [Brevibacterium sp. JSBI002]SMX75690.1 citrate synthase [Brevibacterium iodinum ATCC 49514]SUW12227.1 Citrate synthase 1 [Brevibacterium iodinum]
MTSEANLRIADTELTLPEVSATAGNNGYRIGSLLKETGAVTYDPGFANTATTSSSITYIDGDNGELQYRGYPIEQLAEQSNFVEVCYLLIYGELPTQEQYDAFDARLRGHTIVHEDLRRFFRAFPYDAHPMPMVAAAVAALSTFYQDDLDVFDEDQIDTSSFRLLAKMPTIAALAHRKNMGLPVIHPDNSLSLVENFLRVNFGVPAEEYEPDPLAVKAMDQLFILHADHEQNCSTSTVRLVGSSQANVFQSISAGVNALAGPLHGGANSAVLEMLEQIAASDDGPKKFMERVKNKEDGVRLMGFGHRVYKNYDPRAKIIKKTADEVLARSGGDPLLELAQQLEEIALADDYFVERKLYPNVDFYTGLIYKALGFPTNMFTVLFSVGRLPGWIAQWREMIKDPETKIGRPRQIYTGEYNRNYKDISER